MIKTADEWVKEFTCGELITVDYHQLVSFAKNVQLDVIKHGMTIAVDVILEDEQLLEDPVNLELIKFLKESIIAARDNLKEI